MNSCRSPFGWPRAACGRRDARAGRIPPVPHRPGLFELRRQRAVRRDARVDRQRTARIWMTATQLATTNTAGATQAAHVPGEPADRPHGKPQRAHRDAGIRGAGACHARLHDPGALHPDGRRHASTTQSATDQHHALRCCPPTAPRRSIATEAAVAGSPKKFRQRDRRR